MLSRVADSLYWMSRYLERAEHSVRLLDVNLGLMLEKSGDSVEARWTRVLAALGRPEGVNWEGDYYPLAHTIAFDARCPSSITCCLIAARENARQVRDEISSEQWQQLNRIYHRVTQPQEEERGDRKLADFLSAVTEGVHLFQGVTDTTMSHGLGWQFIQIGRYLERSAATANLLDIYRSGLFQAGDGGQYQEGVGLLRSCTGFEAYCKAYTADLTADRILEFLLFNPEFPHSLRYSVDCLHGALAAVQQGSGGRPAEELARVAGKLQSSLRFAEIEEVLARDTAAYLHGILQQCRRIHELIYRFYIQYSVEAALAMD